MFVELSPVTYLVLCGLVRDAQEIDSDAGGLLARVAGELKGATAGGMIDSELAACPQRLDALRRAGFVAY
ncbi:MAG: hypothetical protein FWF24_03720 [Alphaproteobacteria bacterium]|nr:hypothetical protein [Alphaproteobacteria bacterium]